MYAAIAGLRTHMQNLNVIGNNVANVNTSGYKASRAVFQTSLYTTLTGGSNGTPVMGGTNPSQIGYGSTVATVDVDMSTGNYAVTGKSTDLMLDGAGFFMVGEKDLANNFDGSVNDADRLTSLKLTRVGDFEFKADGYFGKNDGNVVYGFLCVGKWGDDDHPMYQVDENGNQVVDANGNPTLLAPEGTKLGDPVFSDQLVPIRLPRVEPTTVYVVTTPNANGPDTVESWTLTGQNGNNYTWSVTSTDAQGNTAQRTEQTTTAEPATPQGGSVVAMKGAKIVYPQETAGGITENEELSRGLFTNITIDQNTGLVSGTSADTKEVVVIGCVAVGIVSNPNGVTNLGNNYYSAGLGSGEMAVSVLGGNAEAMGISHINASKANADPANPVDRLRIRTSDTKMLSNGLEMSKTDLAQEIANMILTQRGYQANTRIITVTDSMLEELVNMKR